MRMRVGKSTFNDCFCAYYRKGTGVEQRQTKALSKPTNISGPKKTGVEAIICNNNDDRKTGVSRGDEDIEVADDGRELSSEQQQGEIGNSDNQAGKSGVQLAVERVIIMIIQVLGIWTTLFAYIINVLLRRRK
jgi:hypothetical protein